MIELIYTKQRREYAYFRNENGEVTTVNADAFSQTEQQLMQVSSLGLSSSPEINGTNAMYFDTEYQQLKYVSWEYSTERDPRGYVEVRFHSLEDTSVNCLLRTDAMWESLLAVLSAVLKLAHRNPGFLLIDRESLCVEHTSSQMREALMLLVYLLLPKNLAWRIIFINREGNKVPMISATENTCKVPLFSNSEILQLTILQQSEEMLPYQILLRQMMQASFGVKRAIMMVDLPSDLGTIIDALIKLWKSTTRPPISVMMRISDSSNFVHLFSTAFSSEIDVMWGLKSVEEVCAHYIFIMTETQDLRETAMFGTVADSLSFIQHRSDLDAQTAFRLLANLGALLFYEDLSFCSTLCASQFSNVRTPEELIATAGGVSDSSPEKQIAVLASYGKQKEMLELCVRLLNSVEQRLKTYDGLCRDGKFSLVLQEAQLVRRVCETCNVPFAERIKDSIIRENKKRLFTQRLAELFLDGNETLSWLGQYFENWTVEDFFFPLHPDFYKCLANAVERDVEKESERNVLLDLLFSYIPVAQTLYGLESETLQISESNSWFSRLTDAYQKLPDLLRYSVIECQSPSARFAVGLIVNSAFANPITVIRLSELYMEQQSERTPLNLLRLLQDAPLQKKQRNSMADSNCLLYLARIFHAKNGLFSQNEISSPEKAPQFLQELHSKLSSDYCLNMVGCMHLRLGLNEFAQKQINIYRRFLSKSVLKSVRSSLNTLMQ